MCYTLSSTYFGLRSVIIIFKTEKLNLHGLVGKANREDCFYLNLFKLCYCNMHLYTYNSEIFRD